LYVVDFSDENYAIGVTAGYAVEMPLNDCHQLIVAPSWDVTPSQFQNGDELRGILLPCAGRRTGDQEATVLVLQKKHGIHRRVGAFKLPSSLERSGGVQAIYYCRGWRYTREMLNAVQRTRAEQKMDGVRPFIRSKGAGYTRNDYHWWWRHFIHKDIVIG
jgi:hypothetical protein